MEPQNTEKDAAHMTHDQFGALLLGSTIVTVILLAVQLVDDWIKGRARR